MRKSFFVAILCAAVAIGIAADRLYYRNGGNDLVVPANAANQSSSDKGISTPGIVLADGQRLDAQTMGPIIEQYMLDHPELLTRVVAKLQQKEAAEAKAETKTILASAKEELLNDLVRVVFAEPNINHVPALNAVHANGGNGGEVGTFIRVSAMSTIVMKYWKGMRFISSGVFHWRY